MELVFSEFAESVAIEPKSVPGKEVAEPEVAAESVFGFLAGVEVVSVLAPAVMVGACDCVVGDGGAEDCVACVEFILLARERFARSLGAWFCLVQPENRNTNEIEKTNILTMGSP